MNINYSPNSYIVRLRGLPWNTTHAEIEKFLEGCKIRQIQFLTNEQGRASGECFVIVETREDLDLAKSFDKKVISNRYIEIFESNVDEMSQMMKNHHVKDQSNASNNDQWREPVVRLRGLPYNASKNDVIQFFTGLDIAQNGVHISSSKPAGEAFVAFTNMDNAFRALDFNRKNMGHRYIEVFKSNYADARASIMNDTQSAMRQKSTQMTQQPESYPGTNSNSNPRNYQKSINPYESASPPDPYNSYGDHTNNYSMPPPPPPPQNQSSAKRPMSTSFTIKMRGVPFEAGRKEIFEFFNPVVPIELEQENTPRGRPPIWYAEFGSREEATEAMEFHQQHMGKRYIELFPLYDELNHSKMIRT